MKKTLAKIKADMEFEAEQEANNTRYELLGLQHHKLMCVFIARTLMLLSAVPETPLRRIQWGIFTH